MQVKTYVILSVNLRRIKIGRSISPASRFASLRTASPDELVLIGTIDNDIEAELHHKFAKSRVGGEWFELTPDLKAWIVGTFPGANLDGVSAVPSPRQQVVRKPIVRQKEDAVWSVLDRAIGTMLTEVVDGDSTDLMWQINEAVAPDLDPETAIDEDEDENPGLFVDCFVTQWWDDSQQPAGMCRRGKLWKAFALNGITLTTVFLMPETEASKRTFMSELVDAAGVPCDYHGLKWQVVLIDYDLKTLHYIDAGSLAFMVELQHIPDYAFPQMIDNGTFRLKEGEAIPEQVNMTLDEAVEFKKKYENHPLMT